MNQYSWGIAVGILIIASTVGKALAALLRAHAARINRDVSGKDDPQLAQTLEDIQRRLGEMEERMDFTERLLSQQRDGARLSPPKD